MILSLNQKMTLHPHKLVNLSLPRNPGQSCEWASSKLGLKSNRVNLPRKASTSP
jgi:hypothetical protein